jgi:hypothetical protein
MCTTKVVVIRVELDHHVEEADVGPNADDAAWRPPADDVDRTDTLPPYANASDRGTPDVGHARSLGAAAPWEPDTTAASRRWPFALAAVAVVVLVLGIVAVGRLGSQPTSHAAPVAGTPVQAADPVTLPSTVPTNLHADRLVSFSDQCLTVLNPSQPQPYDSGWLQHLAPWTDLDHGLVLLCSEGNRMVLRGYDASADGTCVVSDSCVA